jgi:hypothetical protein
MPGTDDSARPLWFLVPGGIPLPATSKRIEGAKYWCRVGDERWRPIAELQAGGASERRSSDHEPRSNPG